MSQDRRAGIDGPPSAEHTGLMTDPGAIGSERPTEVSRRPYPREIIFFTLTIVGVIRESDRMASGGQDFWLHAVILAFLLFCSLAMVANLVSRWRQRLRPGAE